MSISIRKIFAAALGSLVLTFGNIQADDAEKILRESTGILLDGNRSAAVTHLEETVGRFAGTDSEKKLHEAIDMIKSLDEVDKYVLKDLEQRVGETIYATVMGQRTPVKIVEVEDVDSIQVIREIIREKQAKIRLNITLNDISTKDKLNLLQSMPEHGRALHNAMLAWESRRATPFFRFSNKTGPLATHLQDIGRQRIDSAQEEAARRREERRRRELMARVEGAEDREWEELPEGKITRYKCDITNEFGARMNEQTTGFHYDLYIPEGYNQNPHHWYPVMFIASPGGNARMGRMADRLRRDGWVVVMLVESKNNCPLWVNCFLSAHDDVMKRVRIAPGAKFGTGMSGGARVSSGWPALRPGFRGVILQAAAMLFGFDDDRHGEKFMRNYTPNVAVAMTAGNNDANTKETYKLRILLPSSVLLRIDMFDGGHTWCPAEVFDRVMDWQEKVNFLDPPLTLRPYNSPYGRIAPEEMHPVAYKWFFLLTHRRYMEAESAYEKYYHLSRLPIIAANGNIKQDPEVNDILREARSEFNELRRHPEVVKTRRVEKTFKDFIDKYDRFESSIARMSGNPVYSDYKHQVSRRTINAAHNAMEAGEEIVRRFPDTPQAEFLRGFLPGIEMELDLGQ